MSELPPSPSDELYGELKAFVFERDRDFRNRESDISTISHPPYKRRVATLYDDYNDEISVDVFDTRTLNLEAAYNTTDRERPTRDTKIIFKLGLVATTQLSAAPHHLRHYLAEDQPSHYPSLTPGDFSQTQSSQYIVAHNILIDAPHITHSGDYILYVGDDPIYQVKFPIDQHAYQRIPVATEGRTLIVPPPINEDATSEPHEQIIYDEDFKAITVALKVSPDAVTAELKKKTHAAHTPNLLSLYESSQRDDAQTVRALLKVLRSSNSIPTFDNLYHTIEHIRRGK